MDRDPFTHLKSFIETREIGISHGKYYSFISGIVILYCKLTCTVGLHGIKHIEIFFA